MLSEAYSNLEFAQTCTFHAAASSLYVCLHIRIHIRAGVEIVSRLAPVRARGQIARSYKNASSYTTAVSNRLKRESRASETLGIFSYVCPSECVCVCVCMCMCVYTVRASVWQRMKRALFDLKGGEDIEERRVYTIPGSHTAVSHHRLSYRGYHNYWLNLARAAG